MTRIDDLVAAAEEATADPSGWYQAEEMSKDDFSDDDARFIAAADPTTVLRLVAVARAAEGGLEAIGGFLWLSNNIHNAAADPLRFREFFDAAVDDARTRYDNLRAALAALEE